jgi:hypothetical protein
MLVCVCQFGLLPASVLVCSTRSDEDLALARMIGGPDDALLLHPLHD